MGCRVQAYRPNSHHDSTHTYTQCAYGGYAGESWEVECVMVGLLVSLGWAFLPGLIAQPLITPYFHINPHTSSSPIVDNELWHEFISFAGEEEDDEVGE